MDPMTPEEKQRFDKMEGNVENIQHDVSLIKSAIMGNTLSGEKGLVGQMLSNKAELEAIKAEVKILNEYRIKNTEYVKIIIWCVSSIVAGTITLIFSFFKK